MRHKAFLSLEPYARQYCVWKVRTVRSGVHTQPKRTSDSAAIHFWSNFSSTIFFNMRGSTTSLHLTLKRHLPNLLMTSVHHKRLVASFFAHHLPYTNGTISDPAQVRHGTFLLLQTITHRRIGSHDFRASLSRPRSFFHCFHTFSSTSQFQILPILQLPNLSIVLLKQMDACVLFRLSLRCPCL